MITSTAFREDPTSQVRLVIGGKEITSVTFWVASQDVLMIGDPFSVQLPNPRGIHTKTVTEGASVQLYLSNPAVNGGRASLTHTGLIVDVDLEAEANSGSTLRAQGADRGWHLQDNCPPFLVRGQAQLIERVGLFQLVQRFASNPTWGFADASGAVPVRADDRTNRLIRLTGESVPPNRAQADAAANDNLVIYRLIVEPGQTVADLLTTSARRLNRLVGVGADGVLQVWNPDYNQTPLYRLDYHPPDDPDSVRNNVLAARISKSAAKKYTRVEVVGQLVGWYPTDIEDLAPGRFSAAATQSDLLPFDHTLTYADGEVWDPALAPYAAQWALKRNLYDAFTAVYKVRGHHQNGSWWTAGTMCELHDSVNGLDGAYFVAAVKLMRTRDGDQTEVTLKQKGLLAASFDRLRKV